MPVSAFRRMRIFSSVVWRFPFIVWVLSIRPQTLIQTGPILRRSTTIASDLDFPPWGVVLLFLSGKGLRESYRSPLAGGFVEGPWDRLRKTKMASMTSAPARFPAVSGRFRGGGQESYLPAVPGALRTRLTITSFAMSVRPE